MLLHENIKAETERETDGQTDREPQRQRLLMKAGSLITTTPFASEVPGKKQVAYSNGVIQESLMKGQLARVRSE